MKFQIYSLQKLLFPKKDVVVDIPLEIKNLHDAFNTSKNNNEKCAMLSLIPHSYSKSEIIKMCNCSRYLVDKAKKASSFEKLNYSVTKSRFDTEKVRHFADFLLSSGAIQKIAYRTTVLKFEEIEAQRIPKVVLTVMKSHAICLYRKYCESLNYISVSDSSLYIFLSELKLNQRKTLSGLDNITAAGLSAINNLTELVKKDRLTITSDKKRQLLLKIKNMTNYIKLKYCINCLQIFDGTNSHCPIYAASDPKCDKLSQKCTELHNKSCSDCCNTNKTILR